MRGSDVIRLFFILVGLVALGLSPSSRALACVIAEKPEFEQVTATAEVIVLARIVALSETEAAYTLLTERPLKGTVPERFALDEPVTTACGDAILDAYVGMPLIIALNVPLDDRMISPYWAEIHGELVGVAEIPAGVATLAQLAARIAPVAGSESPSPRPTEIASTRPTEHPAAGPTEPGAPGPTRSPAPAPTVVAAPTREFDGREQASTTLWLALVLLAAGGSFVLGMLTGKRNRR